MQATGIPPHHVIANNIEKMNGRLIAVENVMNTIRNELMTTYGTFIASKVADYLIINNHPTRF